MSDESSSQTVSDNVVASENKSKKGSSYGKAPAKPRAPRAPKQPKATSSQQPQSPSASQGDKQPTDAAKRAAGYRFNRNKPSEYLNYASYWKKIESVRNSIKKYEGLLTKSDLSEDDSKKYSNLLMGNKNLLADLLQRHEQALRLYEVVSRSQDQNARPFLTECGKELNNSVLQKDSTNSE